MSQAGLQARAGSPDPSRGTVRTSARVFTGSVPRLKHPLPSASKCGGGVGGNGHGAHRVSGGCKARPDLRLRTAVCSAGGVESLNLQGRITIAVPTVHASVSGCEGSSIAVLCSVASRVARET